ncbi:MAG: hypothetical protein K2K88_07400 [Muribaculaceae bacterium]|nr:hypothetical protein [Muribaculaceae bacterium]MDE6642748.1 hypothetical protein [Muribaculaceae bacterium]
MAQYKGTPVVIDKSAEELYDRFSNLSFLQDKLSSLPEDMKAKVGEIKFENDRLVLSTAQVGEICFVVKERRQPDLVVFSAEKAPVPIDMSVSFKKISDAQTEVTTSIDVEIPAIMKPLVGPHLQKAADKFGEVMSQLNSL